MSETRRGGSLCENRNVNNVESSSGQSEKNSDSVEIHAVLSPQQKDEDKSDLLNSLVSNVEKSGKTMLVTSDPSAQEGVPTMHVEQLVRSVKSVTSLCDSCAIVIAQSLVQMQQGKDLALIPGLDSIPEHGWQILSQSLVQSVEQVGPADITQITADQNLLNGIVHLVIENYTQEVGKQDRRAFPFHSHVAVKLTQADPVKYQSKSSRRERDAGLGEIPERTFNRANPGGLENEPRFAPTQVRNHHPTCKPLSLLVHLARLLAPPPEYAPRRLLVPFSGSGSEICGAILSGCWEEVVGIEMMPKYVEIAEARCKFWQAMARETGLSDPRAILKVCAKRDKKKREVNPLQLELIDG